MSSLRVIPMFSVAALAGCSIFNTNPDKGSPPSKDGVDDAQGGQGSTGNNTDGNTSQGSVDFGGGGESTLYVVNATSDYDICWIYADSCDGVESDELLGDWYLPPSYYLQVDGLPDDCYDLWAFDCDDSAAWYYGTDISGEFTWILTGGGGYDSGYDSGCYYDSGC